MAKVKQIQLGRPKQMAMSKYVRQELWSRQQHDASVGGFVIADGVGLGKTYEALSVAATLLSQRRHGKSIKRQAFKVLVLVPPGLVTKWAEEIDKFKSLYLTHDWTVGIQTPVGLTFGRPPAVLRHPRDLNDRPGVVRYRTVELPSGLYVLNWNILEKTGKRISTIRNTKWDVIIVDEAHHIGQKLVASKLLSNKKQTATILLTATPFQLSPQEFKGLLTGTFGGHPDPRGAAESLYGTESFRQYRTCLNNMFKGNGDKKELIAKAHELRGSVRGALLPRVARNAKTRNRQYHFVDSNGNAILLANSPFDLDDKSLEALLRQHPLIDLGSDVERFYAQVRDGLYMDRVGPLNERQTGTFIAVALRQLLSNWDQFTRSTFGQKCGLKRPGVSHPKIQATVNLAAQLVKSELTQASARGWIGKVLIFTTYVGAEATSIPSEEESHGTTGALKRSLEKRLRAFLVRRGRKDDLRIQIKDALTSVVVEHRPKSLSDLWFKQLKIAIQSFAGSAPATILLENVKNLLLEKRELLNLLRGLKEAPDGPSKEERRRFEDFNERQFKKIRERYTNKDLVARFDGATEVERREGHLHGFNSPYAPLILIASSVGQEGIDLQQYCRHIIHHDLEWNPAKLEQREGRVDRSGRKTFGPIKVYFALCRGTYDERMLHVMVNRLRWHQVLLATRAASKVAISVKEQLVDPLIIKRVQLDLSPPKAPLHR